MEYKGVRVSLQKDISKEINAGRKT